MCNNVHLLTQSHNYRHARKHTNAHTHSLTHNHTYRYTIAYIYIYTYTYKFIYIRLHTHVYTHEHSKICTSAYTQTHTHSHPRTHTHAQGAHVWKHWDGDSPMDALKEFNALDTGMCASLSLYIRKTINVYIYFCFFPLTGVLDTCRRRGRGVTSTAPSVLCCLTPSAQIFFGRTVLHIFLLVGI